jgi:hypothetical protein
MKKAAHPSRWYTPWRSQRSGDDDDAADMGTAFGLDMSLPDEDGAVATPNPAVKSGAGLMARWATRRKPAT